jgi:hypothetical protein
LSEAPGTVGERATSAISATAATPSAPPSRRPARVPLAAASAASANGQPTGSIAWRFTRPAAPARVNRSFQISPVRAASWWATTTSVARRSPRAGSRPSALAPSPLGSQRRSHCRRPLASSS